MLRFAICIASAIAIVIAASVAALQRSTATQADAPRASARPQDERGAWAYDLAARLGNTAPTAETIAFLVEWTMAEDGGDGAMMRHNPLNTTQSSGTTTMVINGDGVRGYASYEDGIQATIATITNGRYDEVVAGIQTNDPARALAGLIASPWASSHYNGGVGWPRVDPGQYAGAPTIQGVASNPITIGADDCGYNVAVALDANGGALQHVVVRPGETFSFNATMGNPAAISYRNCAGVPGGNWCNLAARYAQVARNLGLALQFQDHGVGDLGGGPENSVAIWNEGGVAGAGQDLLIQNTLARPVVFQAQQDGGSVVIVGGVE